jgi:hypothetical protein
MPRGRHYSDVNETAGDGRALAGRSQTQRSGSARCQESWRRRWPYSRASGPSRRSCKNWSITFPVLTSNSIRVRELIEADPALAARIMRVANSAAYRAYEPCSSVSKAIVRIGATNVCDLAMAMSAMTFFKDLGGVGRKIRDHSAGTAAVARELAFRLGRAMASPRCFWQACCTTLASCSSSRPATRPMPLWPGKTWRPTPFTSRSKRNGATTTPFLAAKCCCPGSCPSPSRRSLPATISPKLPRHASALVGMSVDLLRVADTLTGCCSNTTTRIRST